MSILDPNDVVITIHVSMLTGQTTWKSNRPVPFPTIVGALAAVLQQGAQQVTEQIMREQAARPAVIPGEGVTVGARRNTRGKAADLPAETAAIDPVTLHQDWEIEDFLTTEDGASVGTIVVYRLAPTGKKEFIDNMAPDSYSKQTLRDEYGPGTYELRFKTVDRVEVASKRVNIGRRHSEQGAPALAGQVANGGGGQSLADIQIGFLREQLAQNQAMVLQLMGRKSDADPAAMLQAVSDTFRALQPAAAAPDPMAHIKTVLELAKQFAPREPGAEPEPDSIFGLIKNVADKVFEIPAVRDAISGAVGQPAAIAAGVEGVQVKTMGDLVREKLAYLKSRAALGKDVSLFVESILENDDEPGNEAILSAIQQGVSFDQILAFDLEIRGNAVYQTWFKALYDSLSATIHGAPDTGGSSGDVGDTAGNEKPGAAGLPETKP